MRQLLGLLILGSALIPAIAVAQEQSLKIAYPPSNHQTTYDRIFFIGTAPAAGQVSVNGTIVKRSPVGHFAPSFPLQLGENLFEIRYQNQTVQIKVVRKANQPVIPAGLAFAKDSLTPAVDVAKLAGTPLCFSAVAAPNSIVSVKLGSQTISLLPQPPQTMLPGSLDVFTGRSQPIPLAGITKYEGCTVGVAEQDRELGKPVFQLTQNGQTMTEMGTGKITVLSPSQLQVAEVTAAAGVARTGSSTDHSRLTPLPKSTQAGIVGRSGEWLQLDYGGWINSKETKLLPPGTVAPHAIIRGIAYRKLIDRTEMVFPLSAAVPVTVKQDSNAFKLTLHNTTAQTDLIRLDDNPLISRLDWEQVAPGKIQYTFNLKQSQQWGYKLRYEGTSLVLTLRHPPALSKGRKPLTGIKILIDAGHGGKESGAPGPGGIFEKEVNLTVSKLVQAELLKLGATVVMTREDDRDVSLVDRMARIDREEPVVAVSIHYNSLPDNGDLEKIKGVGGLWYHTQSHSLAVFLQKHLVQKLQRPSYGVFWDNLALTRPTAAPSVLMELGFITNPNEFEWITNPQEQKKLARSIAQGIYEWLQSTQ
jgi:N-acetylmuramoyl-L-alanine amidase